MDGRGQSLRSGMLSDRPDRRRFGIRTRFLASIGVVVAMLMIVGAGAVWYLSRVDAESRLIGERHFPRVVAAQRIVEDADAVTNLSAQISAAASGAERATLLERIESRHRSIDQALHDLEDLGSEADVLTSLRNALDEQTANAARLQELTDQRAAVARRVKLIARDLRREVLDRPKGESGGGDDVIWRGMTVLALAASAPSALAIQPLEQALDAIADAEGPSSEALWQSGRALMAARREQLALTGLIDNLNRSQWEKAARLLGLASGYASEVRNAQERQREHVAESIRHLLVLIGLAFAATAGAVALLFRSFKRSVIEPLVRLIEATRHIAAGTLEVPIPHPPSVTELSDLAEALTVFRDGTQRLRETNEQLKAAQRQLVQSEKLAALGELVAGVAHEINTPIGVAVTATSLLGDRTTDLKRQSEGHRLRRQDLNDYVSLAVEATEMIQANLERAADLVQSFKQVAADRVHDDRRRFALRAWLDELATSLTPALRRTGHRLMVECPDGLVLDSYPGALGQVITNLVMNSLDHGYGEGGSGTMTIAIRPLGTTEVELIYADDGRGIPPEHQAKVFDPFFTTRRATGNTGLGLHIVHNLVTAQLGGSIDLDASSAVGARFRLRLPIRP